MTKADKKYVYIDVHYTPKEIEKLKQKAKEFGLSFRMYMKLRIQMILAESKAGNINKNIH